MATHSNILAWRILLTEEPGGLLSIGSHRVRHDWSDLACIHALEKEMATHSSILAWRIPGTGEPGGLPSMGSRRGRHDWSDLAAAAQGYTELKLHLLYLNVITQFFGEISKDFQFLKYEFSLILFFSFFGQDKNWKWEIVLNPEWTVLAIFIFPHIKRKLGNFRRNCNLD